MAAVFAAAKEKTRIWASSPTPPQKIGQSGPLSSTSHWGSTFCSYEIAVERLVGKYFPYGQERPSATTDGKEKFATYFRDSETGLDYADQRYEQPGMGRFMTPDPAKSGWNWYAYAGGDPVNNNDPSGLNAQWSDAGCNPDAAAFNPAGYMALCQGIDPSSGLQGEPTDGYEDAGGGSGYEVNPSVFANDLGQVGPGSGRDPLAFSRAYDLVYFAVGFDNDPTDPNRYRPVFGPGFMGGTTTLPWPWAIPGIPSVPPLIGVLIGGVIGWELGSDTRTHTNEGIQSENVADTSIEQKMRDLMKARGLGTCQALQILLDAATSAEERLKIIRTQKAYGCRNARKR